MDSYEQSTVEQAVPFTPVVVEDGGQVTEQAIDVPPGTELVATPEGDRGPVEVIATDTHAPPIAASIDWNELARLAGVVEGAEVLFYGQAHEPPVRARITHVWGPSCVNLDNAASSVPVFRLGTPDTMPTAYFCVLASDVPTVVIEPQRPVVLCELTRVADAQRLPELRGDANLDPIEFAPGAIRRFKSEDRRTMEIVAIGGALACKEVTNG